MGRGSDNDIIIDSGSVSGKHAEMHRVKGGYELRDLGSTNGIKLKGNRQQVITLHSGMTAHLGDVSFEFSLTDDEQETLKKEKPYEDLPPIKDEEPKKKASANDDGGAKPFPRRKPEPVAQPAEVGFGMIVFFLILAGAAFCVGLAVRHNKDTGESLLKAMVNKEDRAAEEAAPGE